MAAEYFAHKEVFVTGGTGVLGKGFIEKLLRSTDVKKIYLLLRMKKGQSVFERMEDFRNGKMFDRLRREKPNALDKVIMVPGDITLPGLGMSSESIEITKNTDLFIHSAATVRFNEPFKTAVQMNVGGTYECIKIAKNMKNLKLFIHVSTYFSNPQEKFVKNILYPAPMDWRVALKLIEKKIPDDCLEAIAGKCIEGFPNTYTFTKNLAEHVVNDHKDMFPVMITRPSVIIFAREEPEPGYAEKFQGVTGIIAFLGTGLVHSFLGQPDVKLDMIFSDLVVNLHLLSIVRQASKPVQERSNPDIVLICGSEYDPYTLGLKLENVNRASRKYVYNKCFGYFDLKTVTCYYHFLLRFFIYQIIPSFFLDILLKFLKIKPFVMRTQRKIFTGNMEIAFFVFNSFKNAGITNLEELEALGRGNDFDIRSSLYSQQEDKSRKLTYEEFVLSNRKFLLKEKDSSIPKARRKLTIFRYIHYAVQVFKILIFTWVLSSYISSKIN